MFDSTIGFVERLRQVLNPKKSHMDTFQCVHSFAERQFMTTMKNELQDFKQRGKKSGEWKRWTINQGGVPLLQAVLDLESLPTKERDGVQASVLSVTEMAYNSTHKKMRVRGRLDVSRL